VTTAFTRLRARDRLRWQRRAASTAAVGNRHEDEEDPAVGRDVPFAAGDGDDEEETGVAADHDAGDGGRFHRSARRIEWTFVPSAHRARRGRGAEPLRRRLCHRHHTAHMARSDSARAASRCTTETAVVANAGVDEGGHLRLAGAGG
jgi:hypothetical protein